MNLGERVDDFLSAWYRRARSKKHSGIRDTRVLKFHRLDRNHIFLRWHYPDQVQGFEKTILVSAGRITSTPFQLIILLYYATHLLSIADSYISLENLHKT